MSGGLSNILFVGQRVIRLDQVDSTNNFALGLLKGTSLQEGAVITTTRQTRGKGQRGNSWDSDPGLNITCSIILRPTFLDLAQQFDLTRVVSLAMTDVLQKLLPTHDVKVKWPNDIFVGKQKIAGILIENVVFGSQLSYSVIGIGLNVNQQQFVVNGLNAVSLANCAGHNFDLEEILQLICGAVEARYLQLRSGKLAILRELYLERLFNAGINSQFTDFNAIFEATIVDVTLDGHLILQDSSGVQRKFAMKEVAWVG